MQHQTLWLHRAFRNCSLRMDTCLPSHSNSTLPASCIWRLRRSLLVAQLLECTHNVNMQLLFAALNFRIAQSQVWFSKRCPAHKNATGVQPRPPRCRANDPAPRNEAAVAPCEPDQKFRLFVSSFCISVSTLFCDRCQCNAMSYTTVTFILAFILVVARFLCARACLSFRTRHVPLLSLCLQFFGNASLRHLSTIRCHVRLPSTSSGRGATPPHAQFFLLCAASALPWQRSSVPTFHRGKLRGAHMQSAHTAFAVTGVLFIGG